MKRLSDNKIVLITRSTRLDELIRRFNTTSQAQFYIEHLGGNFKAYQEEDTSYKLAVRETVRVLTQLGRLQQLDRSFVPNFIFAPDATVVVLGQDGLVANVLKYLDNQPLIGVNPDKSRWAGVLLPFEVKDLSSILPQVFAKTSALRQVSMAKARLNTGEVLYGVNDLFIGPKSHISARYRIELAGDAEEQSSSGIIVSTGLGSTGWLKSIVAGARGISAFFSGDESLQSMLSQSYDASFPWDADYLYFSVREPWPSQQFSARLACGKIGVETPLIITSQMSEHGVIFSDGIEQDYLPFQAGSQAIISLAEKKGLLVM
ncbi:MAG: hypothetical protein R2880_03020 [Deinococcales bacterium]